MHPSHYMQVCVCVCRYARRSNRVRRICMLIAIKQVHFFRSSPHLLEDWPSAHHTVNGATSLAWPPQLPTPLPRPLTSILYAFLPLLSTLRSGRLHSIPFVSAYFGHLICACLVGLKKRKMSGKARWIFVCICLCLHACVSVVDSRLSGRWGV